MDQSLITKKVIAYSFKNLMNKMSFAKITVSDIMKQADLRRQTFYYHFQDKYELIEWIYKTESQENIRDFIDYERWDSILEYIFVYFYREQDFYRNALLLYEQNSFSRSLFENLQDLYLEILNDESFTNAEYTDKRKVFLARFLSHGMVGTLIEWIESGCKTPHKEIADNLYLHLLDICGK
ncbi:dihydroxyacetone kinase transcriptional activator DhaS [Alkalibacterium sp. s-m-22]